MYIYKSNDTGNKFLKKATASKAASKNCGMQYIMWEYFGAYAVFFSVTPDDENSFCIWLCASCVMK